MKKRIIFLSGVAFFVLVRWTYIQQSISKDLSDTLIENSLERLSKIRLEDIEHVLQLVYKFKENVIQQLMAKDPNRNRPAALYANTKRLDPGYSLEGEFLSNRLEKTRIALQKYTGLQIPHNAIPRIGFVFSGGGYRAMILTSAYLKGFEELGIFDAAQYMVGLSGSSWWIGPYVFMQSAERSLSVEAFNNKLKQKIEVDIFNPVSKNNILSFSKDRVANDIIFPKVVFGQPISSVDFYGALLAHALLSDFGAYQQRKHLSDQYFHIKSGAAPWPIYTAVSMHSLAEHVYMYNWYEFNPEEIRNLELDIALPAFAFGRSFNAGKSQDFAPEQSFGFLMGIFGSAFAVNLNDLKRIMLGDGLDKKGAELLLEVVQDEQEGDEEKVVALSENPSIFQRMKNALVERVLISLGDTRIGKKRAAPASINNPFKGYEGVGSWLHDRDLLTFIDAGIAYNIPLRPLFRPDRQLDIIFVGDGSSNVESADELKKAFADLERVYKITYAKDEEKSDKTVQVYRSSSNNAPIIIYINFLKDDDLITRAQEDPKLAAQIEKLNLSEFNVQECLDEGYCSTFNFNYSLNQFEQLSLVGQLNVMMHNDLFLELIEERIEQDKFEFGS